MDRRDPLDNTDWESVYTYSSISTNATADNLPGPGRTLDLFYNFAGRLLERRLNTVAEELGYGPRATAQRIQTRRAILASAKYETALPMTVVKRKNEKIEKDCRKLIKYLNSDVTSTREQALGRLTDLAFDDQYIRELFNALGAAKNIQRWVDYDVPLLNNSRKALVSLTDVEASKNVQSSTPKTEGSSPNLSNLDQSAVGNNIYEHAAAAASVKDTCSEENPTRQSAKRVPDFGITVNVYEHSKPEPFGAMNSRVAKRRMREAFKRAVGVDTLFEQITENCDALEDAIRETFGGQALLRLLAKKGFDDSELFRPMGNNIANPSAVRERTWDDYNALAFVRLRYQILRSLEAREGGRGRLSMRNEFEYPDDSPRKRAKAVSPTSHLLPLVEQKDSPPGPESNLPLASLAQPFQSSSALLPYNFTLSPVDDDQSSHASVDRTEEQASAIDSSDTHATQHQYEPVHDPAALVTLGTPQSIVSEPERPLINSSFAVLDRMLYGGRKVDRYGRIHVQSAEGLGFPT
ncbi:hypothetical protein EW145_g4225 [Phellinidium pouzarii]|uniref:Uncharacterized protein n=1 Tax=Phellinidium pouzarii TaxID=167371 RepID=A0A4V3XCK2_9AGAM|nr:hypothetical protein EW145_g4225 [Phellinidium pouzarii]